MKAKATMVEESEILYPLMELITHLIAIIICIS